MTSLGRRYWTLFGGFTSANLGDGLTLVGFPLLAVSLTDDARLVAAVTAVRFVPYLVIGLPAGVLIDRVDRRHLAIVAQLGRAAVVVAIAAAVVADAISIGSVLIGAFVIGVGEVLTDGGLPAVVRDVVESSSLEEANGRLRASETVANLFIGPPVGAFLFGVDAWVPFACAGVLYIGTVGFLALLPGSFRAEAEAEESSFLRQMTRGLRYVWDHAVLRPLALTVAAFAFVGEANNAVFVILITEELGWSEFQYGLILTVDAVASVTMSFLVPGLIRRTSHGRSMRLSVVFFALGSFLLGLSTFAPLIVLAMLCGGISDPSWNIVSGTVRQRLVDDYIFGRMMTAYLFVAWSMQPAGAMLGGVIAEAVGPRWVYVMAGVIVSSLLVFAHPMFQRIDAAMAHARAESEHSGSGHHPP